MVIKVRDIDETTQVYFLNLNFSSQIHHTLSFSYWAVRVEYIFVDNLSGIGISPRHKMQGKNEWKGNLSWTNYHVRLGIPVPKWKVFICQLLIELVSPA